MKPNQINSKYNSAFVAVLGLAITTLSARAELLFDRGLPTLNLNLAAGANRANIAWADSEATAAPLEYWLPGDNFTLSGSGPFLVNTIRVWTIGNSNNLSLLGGLGGGIIDSLSTTYTATPVTYSGATTYENTAGAFIDLYQVDFTVNLTLDAGQTYNFFVSGPWTFVATDDFRNTPLHSSNGALSGSPQQGADGTFLWLHVDGADQVVETWQTGTGLGTSGFGAGWDKNSDGDVQVFGAQVPEPSSVALLSCSLLLLPFRSLRRNMRKHA